jgi:peroxiredoxin
MKLTRVAAWALRVAPAGFGALVGAGCLGDSTRADDSADAFRPLVVGEPMPFYTAATLNGEPVNVGAVGELIVLNVWATWCTSCREEMADLNALQREFGPMGVRVVGVSVDGGSGMKVSRFAEREKLEFAVAHDPEQRVQQTYQVLGVPETFVIGKDGRLRWRHVGNLHPVLDSLRAAIAAAVRSP